MADRTVVERNLVRGAAFDPQTQREVAGFAVQLDDQLRLLREVVAGMTPADLSWQPGPGLNTIGMLLAHLAVAETYWMGVMANRLPFATADEVLLSIIGIHMDDDGLPLARTAGPPAHLDGKPLEWYLSMLERARATTHATLKGITDAALDGTWDFEPDEDWGRDKAYRYNLRWIIYHVLEHFCQHAGQIGMLKHMREDARGPVTTS